MTGALSVEGAARCAPARQGLRRIRVWHNHGVAGGRGGAARPGPQGQGLGTALLIDALRRCRGISEEIGAAAVVLDVLGDADFERRWSFYAGLGFRPLGDPENPRRVFIPMADVRATLG